MASLIAPPDLDLRDEEQLAAEAISRVSGGLDADRINSQILMLRDLLTMVQAGGLPSPICPELTNANPSSPHTVLLETLSWQIAQIARRINQLPVRDEIEFARLFGIEVRDATPATTVLTFTVTPTGSPITVPAGTRASTTDGVFVFQTSVDLVIGTGLTTGTVAAECLTAGAILLSPGQLITLVDPVAHVTAVTNSTSVDSGSDAETVDQALDRARSFQRRGTRIVSAEDLEDAVLQDVLNGNGVVRAFPFFVPGDFVNLKAGHTTLVVMTVAGNPVDDATKVSISSMLEQMVGSQFVYLLDPQYVPFNVEANIRLSGSVSQSVVMNAVRANLQAFYAPASSRFGQSILRAESIAVIEGTPGVERIVSAPDGPVLIEPLFDIAVASYQIPQLQTVTLHVV